MKEVHAVDLAASFNYSKASISIALKKLKDRGLVALGPKQQLYLTPDGLEIASRIYERHEVIGSIFTYLGVEEEVAYKDACKIEHVGKHKKVGNCGCGTCPMGQDKKAKRFLKEYHKQNKKDEQ